MLGEIFQMSKSGADAELVMTETAHACNDAFNQVEHETFSEDDENTNIGTDVSEDTWAYEGEEEDYSKTDNWDFSEATEAIGCEEWATWNPVINQCKDDWDSPERKLRDQSYSDSLVARTLANLEIIVEPDCQSILAQIESSTQATILARRKEALMRRRRERVLLVNTPRKLKTLLGHLELLDLSKPQVVIDCEGLNFRRTGTIDIMELYIEAHDTLYLIDIVALKEAAWTITSPTTEFCLRTLLSSSSYKKIMWDIRMDACILNILYGIRLSGVIDASLWEVAYRLQKDQTASAYRVSIEEACRWLLHRKVDMSEILSLEEAKSARQRLPPRPWALRPLPMVLIDYAADVKYIGMLYSELRRSLCKSLKTISEIESCTEQELEIVCDRHWNPDTGSAESPWCCSYFTNRMMILEMNREDAIKAILDRLCEDVSSKAPVYKLSYCVVNTMKTAKELISLVGGFVSATSRPLLHDCMFAEKESSDTGKDYALWQGCEIRGPSTSAAFKVATSDQAIIEKML